jgi:hypothetical protein
MMFRTSPCLNMHEREMMAPVRNRELWKTIVFGSKALDAPQLCGVHQAAAPVVLPTYTTQQCLSFKHYSQSLTLQVCTCTLKKQVKRANV